MRLFKDFKFEDFKEFLKWFCTLSPKGAGMQIEWNTLPPSVRYFGFKKDWYDGPMYSFSLYFWHLTLLPSGSAWHSYYKLGTALQEAVESNPTLFLISNNETLRGCAQKCLLSKKPLNDYSN